MQADNNQLRQNKKRLIELLNQKTEREREENKKNRLAEKERKLKEKEINKKEKDSQNQLKIITNKGKKRGRKPKLNKENENIEENVAEDVIEEIDYNPFEKKSCYVCSKNYKDDAKYQQYWISCEDCDSWI